MAEEEMGRQTGSVISNGNWGKAFYFCAPIEIFFYWFRKALVLNMFFCTKHNLSGIPRRRWHTISIHRMRGIKLMQIIAHALDESTEKEKYEIIPSVSLGLMSLSLPVVNACVWASVWCIHFSGAVPDLLEVNRGDETSKTKL